MSKKSNGTIRVNIPQKEIEEFKRIANKHIGKNKAIKNFECVIWFAIGYFDDDKVIPIEVIEWAQSLAMDEVIDF